MDGLHRREVDFTRRLFAAVPLGLRRLCDGSLLECRAHAVAELGGIGLGERDGGEPLHWQFVAGDELDDATHQGGGLARARASFDKKCGL